MSAPYVGINTIQIAQNELAGMMHGSTINQLQNPFGVYNRAARRVLNDVDPWETKVVLPMGQVFDQVFDYSCPVDLKDNKIIDIAPQTNRSFRDNFGQSYNKGFDLTKSKNRSPQFSLLSNSGQRTLRVSASEFITGIPVNLMENTTDNGLFTLSGNANTLQQDNLYFAGNASSSLSFNLAATGIPGSTGSILNSTMNAIDLLTQFNQGVEFLYVWLPQPASITNIQLQWGSSSGAYYQVSATTQYTGAPLQAGWNLISFPWLNAPTPAGTPNSATITFMNVTFTYDGTLQTAIRVCDYESRLGVILNLEYYSKYLFRNATTNAMQETTTALTDFVQLDTTGYDLWLMAVGMEAVQQMQGLDALFYDSNNFTQKYQNALTAYKLKNRSEITKPRSYYYRMPRRGRSGWGGWNGSQPFGNGY